MLVHPAASELNTQPVQKANPLFYYRSSLLAHYLTLKFFAFLNFSVETTACASFCCHFYTRYVTFRSHTRPARRKNAVGVSYFVHLVVFILSVDRSLMRRFSLSHATISFYTQLLAINSISVYNVSFFCTSEVALLVLFVSRP